MIFLEDTDEENLKELVQESFLKFLDKRYVDLDHSERWEFDNMINKIHEDYIESINQFLEEENA